MKNTFVLQLMGSIVMLIVLFSGFGYVYPMAKWAAYVWQPVFYSVAILSSLFLLVAGFSNLLKTRRNIVNASLAAAMVAGFCIAGLTYGNFAFLVAGLIGFSLSFIGSGLSHNTYHRSTGKKFKESSRKEVFVLQFMGSVIFILVAFTAFNAAYPSAWLQGGSLQELLYSISLVGSLGMFFISFMNMSGKRGIPHGTMFVVVITGLSMLILTFGSLVYFSLSLVGLVLLIIGADIFWKAGSI